MNVAQGSMQYVLLIAGQPLVSGCVSQVAEVTRTSLFTGEDGTYHFDMHDDATRIRIEDTGSSLSDWEDEPEKLARLKRLGSPAHVYVMHYKSVNRLRAVLVALAARADFIIDDDYEIFADGAEFVALSEAHPDDNQWWLGGHYS